MSLVDRSPLAAKGFANPVGFGSCPALLVVDLINGFTDPESPLGSDASATIAQTNKLIGAARARSLPVLFSTIRYDDPACADAGIWITKIAGLKVLAANTDGSQIDSRLLREPGDPVIVKKFASCFFGTDLASRLFTGGINGIVLAGCSTSGCIRATAVDACQYGLRTIVAEDAVTDRSAAAHRQSLIDINDKYGDVLSVEQVMAAFAGLDGRTGS